MELTLNAIIRGLLCGTTVVTELAEDMLCAQEFCDTVNLS